MMASRSRLGRDPLDGVAQPKTKKPARKKAPAKAKAAKPAAAQAPETRSRTPELPECAAAAVLPDTPAEPAQESQSRPEPSQPVPPEAAAATAPIEPAPQSEPLAEPAGSETAAQAPSATPEPETTPQPAAQVTRPAPAEDRGDAAACAHPLAAGPNPAEVFLRGILEGLVAAGGLTLDVAVAPETCDIPVETLFYCSHALQLLVSPLEAPYGLWRRPGRKDDPPACLSVRLGRMKSGRHSVRVYDNGLFFRGFLAEISLQTEALRPLLLFVKRRGGSICLKRGGACVEFEIIG